MAGYSGELDTMDVQFKIRRCSRFVAAKEETKYGDDCVCQCGYKRSEHQEKALRVAEQTTPTGGGEGTTGQDSCCIQEYEQDSFETDACGTINFGGINPCPSKYIRLDKDTDMDQVLDLFGGKWGLRPPKLLISVTGGAIKCNMDTDLKRNFRRGLLKAAASTGAWITSGGTRSGVMKHVGKAVLEYTEAYGIQEDLVVLGVATWGCVTNRETLRNRVNGGQGSETVYYEVEGTEGKGECSLDPNHTHFLLVDDGTCNKYGGEIDFRTRLEAKLSEASGTDREPVPVVCVALEGGRGTLHTIKSSLEQNIPVVVFQGSGRVADIVAEAVSGDRDLGTHDSELEKVLGPGRLTEHKQWLKECLKRRDLLTVYNIHKDANLDEAILTAILKMSKYSTVKKIRLAQTWNRYDMAIKFIKMSPEVTEHRKDYDSIFLEALQNNQVDLVKRFLHTGVVTRGQLLSLYRDTQNLQGEDSDAVQGEIVTNLPAKKYGKYKDITLEDVGPLLKQLLSSSDSVLYENGSDTGVHQNKNKDQLIKLQDMEKGFDVPQRHVFFWCVVTNKKDLALLFWDTAKEGLVLALIAQRILQRLRAITEDSERQRQLEESEKFFADFAVTFLNFLYEQDEDRCRKLVVRGSGILGRKTALDIALESNNRSFVAHPVCQSVLNDIWRGDISQETSLFRIMLAVVFPMFAGLIVKREEKAQDRDEDVDQPTRNSWTGVPIKPTSRKKSKGSGSTVPSSGQRGCNCLCVHVYRAPIAKFILNTLSFLAFLVLFSISLCCFFDNLFHWYDGVLIVWVTSMISEELRQLCTAEGQRVISKLKHYIWDVWNVLDISAAILYLTALFLRFLPSTSCPNCLVAARIIGAFSGALYFLRFLDIFSVSRYLGPKVLMLGRMMKELGAYVLILLVLVSGFGVVSQALLFPNSPLDGSLLKNILRRPYYHIYGELFFDEVEESNCTAGERCPDPAGSYVVLVLLAVYILFTNVLVLNLIIAMFSFTVTKIHENNNKYWRMQRYHVIKEFYYRPVLPPPFVLLAHIAGLVLTIFGHGQQKCDEFYVNMSPEEDNALLSWETLHAYDFIHQRQSGEKNGQCRRLSKCGEYEVTAPGEETENCNRISQRISSAFKISRTDSSVSW